MTLEGRVKIGLGEGMSWIEKAATAFRRKTGMKLFWGTLNLELSKPYKLGEDVMILHKQEYGGIYEVLVKKCKLMGHDSYIVRTEKQEAGER